MADYLPLEVQRNGTLAIRLSFLDNEGDPLDLTGAAFAMGVRYAAGSDGVRLASAQVDPDPEVPGAVEVRLDGAVFGAVPGKMEIVVLAYDLIATQDGVRMPLLRGPLSLLPGVS